MTVEQLTGIIDPQWRIDDLDPATWRAIGSYIDPAKYVMAGRPGERGLFVLHDHGKILRVVDSADGIVNDFDIAAIDNPRMQCQSLYERGRWDRVHIIDRAHLQTVSRNAQAIENRQLTLDAYYRRVFQVLWDSDDGYVCVPPRDPHWNHWTYAAVEEFLRELPSPSTLALGVFGSNRLAIGIVILVSEGMVRRVTTFEALALEPRSLLVDGNSADAVSNSLVEIGPPAAVLLCTDHVFQDWIELANKRNVIDLAVAAGTAVVRGIPLR